MSAAPVLVTGRDRTLGESAVLRKALLFVELILLAVVIDQTRVISPAFIRVFQVAAVGAFLNEFVPQRLRPSFFLVLSIVSTAAVLTIAPTAVLVVLGLAFVGICHLPLRARYRIVLILAFGGILAAYRSGLAGLPMPSMDILVILPVLASMFMFRLFIYLYDKENATEQLSLVQTLNYFFMVPNVCFPLFPCIDYATFIRTYRTGKDRWHAQQRGVRLVLEGTVHLLLLRLVELYVVRDPYRLETRLDHLLYIVSAYMLYLRVSGQFHIVAGILHLFGYDLPRTNNRYFLAASFTDLWRRINIYWMEFMRKMIYYPVVVRARRLGEPGASILATVCVFGATIVLHSYQFYWLSGTFSFTSRDFLFWTLLCVLVIVDMQLERRAMRRRRPRLGARAGGLKGGLPARPALRWRVVLRTATTLFIMTILWSLWSSESISLKDWASILTGVVVR